MFSLTLLFGVIWYGSFDGDCLNVLLTFFPFAFLPRTAPPPCFLRYISEKGRELASGQMLGNALFVKISSD